MKGITSAISKLDRVSGSAVSIDGHRPEQYDNFELLQREASVPELITLTYHPSPVVRCYSFWALHNQQYDDLFTVLLDHISDTATTETQFGCIVGREKVADFMINLMTPTPYKREVTVFNKDQLSILDSILIHEPNELWATSAALMRAQPTEELYPRIRELVLTGQNQTALLVLAGYQKEEDVDLILNNTSPSARIGSDFYYTYQAIAIFPHPNFFPFLSQHLQETFEKTHYNSGWSELYGAIAIYKDSSALHSFEQAFENTKGSRIRRYHMQFLFSALMEHHSPIYDPLLWKLWKEEGRVSYNSFEYLWDQNSDQAMEATLNSLENIGDFGWGEDSLLQTMLQHLFEKDSSTAMDIVRQNLEKAPVGIIHIFTDRVIEMQDSTFIDPLFKRLETEWNGHVYLEVAKALLSYNSPDIKSRIIATRDINPALNEGWAGTELDSILEEDE